MKLIRVLEYEGDGVELRDHLRNRGVKGLAPAWNRRSGYDAITIKERFVLPDPLPEWWDEVVPAIEKADPTADADVKEGE